jgi:hypothetical protein
MAAAARSQGATDAAEQLADLLLRVAATNSRADKSAGGLRGDKEGEER